LYVLIYTNVGSPSLDKPILDALNRAERQEAVNARTVELVGTSRISILLEMNKLFDNQELYATTSSSANPYGNRDASFQYAADIC